MRNAYFLCPSCRGVQSLRRHCDQDHRHPARFRPADRAHSRRPGRRRRVGDLLQWHVLRRNAVLGVHYYHDAGQPHRGKGVVCRHLVVVGLEVGVQHRYRGKQVQVPERSVLGIRLARIPAGRHGGPLLLFYKYSGIVNL